MLKWWMGLLLVSFCVCAQHAEQPLPQDTTDLRSQTTVFSIELIETQEKYHLARTAELDYWLKHQVGNNEKIIKLPSREGAKLDREFATKFLKCQYEILEVVGDCKVAMRLNLKGESQDVCQKDDKKSQEISSFMTELGKRF